MKVHHHYKKLKYELEDLVVEQLGLLLAVLLF